MTDLLPVPGEDDGTWGPILNTFLLVSLNEDGTLNPTAISGTTGDMAIVAGAATLQGTVNVESLIRSQQLDQMTSPGSAVCWNGQRLAGLAAPAVTTDAAQALGSQIGFTAYTPSSPATYTIASTTGAAVDTTNLTVSFTALSAQVLVEVETYIGFFTTPAIGQSISLTLYTHSALTQQGGWTIAFVAPATSTASTERTRSYIYVTGLTAETSYQWDLGWACSAGTAIMSAQVTQGAAETGVGGIYMRVFAQ